ncbi:MAG: hypothetical protein PHT79_05455 [Syntrophomonadaceae bacterium]|nr:hypothetical protein [Syntrophomonadaceae bacterium]MDD3888439.1 hypothetical protein [Syntrophomonadaceae bacterium]MDD4549191.1 hypothetical protein [Syntrophomonadaceae bacterium]
MKEIPKFRLDFIKQEKHLLLPTTTSIIVVQNLYDVLFQYAINAEKEKKLKYFINLLESHIKSKTRAPFSIPLEELEFLDDGLQELKLLNWLEAPVSVFELFLDESVDEEKKEKTFDLLQDMIIFNFVKDSSRIYVYPSNLTIY